MKRTFNYGYYCIEVTFPDTEHYRSDVYFTLKSRYKWITAARYCCYASGRMYDTVASVFQYAYRAAHSQSRSGRKLRQRWRSQYLAILNTVRQIERVARDRIEAS